jgi:uncharacterized protein YceK
MHRLWLIAFLSAAVSGCGTVANLMSENPTPYGGIHKDLEFVASGKTAFDLSGSPSTSNSPWGAALLLGLFAAEPPLSLLADTVTLPFVLARHHPEIEAPDATTSPPRPDAFSTSNPPAPE